MKLSQVFSIDISFYCATLYYLTLPPPSHLFQAVLDIEQPRLKENLYKIARPRFERRKGRESEVIGIC